MQAAPPRITQSTSACSATRTNGSSSRASTPRPGATTREAWSFPEPSEALGGEGYSFFFNTKLPVLDRKLNLFARYDHFDPDRKNEVTTGDDCYDLVNGGVAWEFYHHFMWLLAYEQIMYEKNNGGLGKVPAEDDNLADDWRVQTVLQISF